MNRSVVATVRSSCWPALLMPCVFGEKASMTGMHRRGEVYDLVTAPVSAVSQGTRPATEKERGAVSCKEPNVVENGKNDPPSFFRLGGNCWRTAKANA